MRYASSLQLAERLYPFFETLDDSTLQLLTHVTSGKRPRRRQRTRNGRVHVRYEQLSESTPVAETDRLKALAQAETNWAWGDDHELPPGSRHRF